MFLAWIYDHTAHPNASAWLDYDSLLPPDQVDLARKLLAEVSQSQAEALCEYDEELRVEILSDQRVQEQSQVMDPERYEEFRTREHPEGRPFYITLA